MRAILSHYMSIYYLKATLAVRWSVVAVAVISSVSLVVGVNNGY